MKKTILVVALLLGGLMFQKASAQLRVSFKVNIATQPVWGPVGYDHVEYYYMPDIDAYYYVPTRQYIYLQRGRWIFCVCQQFGWHGPKRNRVADGPRHKSGPSRDDARANKRFARLFHRGR